MSAVQSSIQIAPAPPPAPAGTRFIPLAEAARRSGRVTGHLARLCRDEWLAAGKAELRPPLSGKGKMTWWIREDADPALARVLFPEQIPFDMSAIDKPHRDVILSREKILQEWQASVARSQAADPRLTRLAATLQFCQIAKDLDGHRISPRTLQLWQSAYRAEGRAGLQDDRKSRSRVNTDNADPFLNEVKRLWLRLSQPKKQTCYDHAKLIAEHEGWPICAFKKADRFLNRIDPRVVIKMRLGDKAHEEQVVPPVRRDYTTLSSNEIWCADHHQLDVIVKGPDGKHCRPWLTAWEDMRSRKIVGYHLFCHDPNQETVLLAFRHAVQSCGGGAPQWVYLDNGKDFDCWSLQGQSKWQRLRKTVRINTHHVGGLFGALKTQVIHAKPYNAKAKPIERFFYTLKTRFSQMLWPTYCGGKPDEKPEDLPEILARGSAPDFADFHAAFAAWVDADYNARVHTGQGMDEQTPEECWIANLTTLRTCSAADLELLLQKTTDTATVTNQGVAYKKGLGYGKGDPALDAYFGQKVYLRIDPADVSKASAWTLDDKLIGFLAANGLTGFHATEQEYREAEASRKRVRDSVKAVQQLGPTRHYDTLDFMRAKRIKQLAAQRPDPTQPPPVLQPIRTAIEGQLSALQNARGSLALRLAAGGERDVPAPPPRRSLLDAGNDLDLDVPPSRSGPSILSLAERLGD